jgi:hypothetical protein
MATPSPDSIPLVRRGYSRWYGPACALVLVVGSAAMLRIGEARVSHRHFNVDEFENAFNSYLMTCEGQPGLANPLEPYLIALSVPFRCPATTATALIEFRSVFLLLLLACFAAIALVQDAYRSWAGRIGVFLVIGLSPQMWRYGIEIRHDILILACALVVLHAALRESRGGGKPVDYLLTGAAFVTATVNSYKSPVLLAPMIGVLLLNRFLAKRSWAEPLKWLTAGAIAGAIPWAAILVGSGAGSAFVTRVGDFLHYSTKAMGHTAAGGYRAAPLLLSLLIGMPIVGALALLSLVGTAYDWVSRRDRNPSSARTVCLFALAAVFAISLNPVPYGYNANWLYPFLFLPALYAAEKIDKRTWVPAVILAGLVIESAVTLSFRNDYDDQDNAEQLRSIALAEALTGPTDPVIDGVGLVPTRPPAGDSWLLHSLLMDQYNSGRLRSIHETIAQSAPPVLLRTYRTYSLPAADQQAIQSAYVRIGGAIDVLGGNLSERAGYFTIRRGGRYVLHCGAPGETEFLLDGAPISTRQPVALTAGSHAYACRAAPFTFTWVGPRLENVPKTGGSGSVPFYFEILL